MRRFFNIVFSSLKMAWEEMRSNKLRTFLSLLGITFGIFCIISVLATISSMKSAIKSDFDKLGSNSIFIDKWQWTNDNDYPWWKYVKRPFPKMTDVRLLKEKVPILAHAAFFSGNEFSIDDGYNKLSNVQFYGVTEDFAEIEQIDILAGRYLRADDFDRSSTSVVIGYNIAEKLFGDPARAPGKSVRVGDGKPAAVVGVIAKRGQSMVNAFDYDNCVMLSVGFMRQLVRDDEGNPKILVAGSAGTSVPALKDELTAAMRSIHKLHPGQEDDFSLNDIASISSSLDETFSKVNIGGWAIAALSLVVGMFGVANIMFVTVRERTAQIGLKKALGAKRNTIMAEFLLESAFLCLIGGAIGLISVFVLAAIFSTFLPFHVFIPADIIAMAIGICVTVGIAAGIVPAYIAARLDPVVAIRSTT